jgi:mRNA interferase RelE/StbE
LAWTVEISETAVKQLKKLDPQVARRIRDYIRAHLVGDIDPRDIGIALAGELSGFWRYRVGDWRLVCEIKDDRLVVALVELGHRKEVYN